MALQITLNEVEIQKALVAHVATLGLNTEGKVVDIKLTVGRKANSSSVEVTIRDSNEPVGDTEEVVKEPAKARQVKTPTPKVESVVPAQEEVVAATEPEVVEEVEEVVVETAPTTKSLFAPK